MSDLTKKQIEWLGKVFAGEKITRPAFVSKLEKLGYISFVNCENGKGNLGSNYGHYAKLTPLGRLKAKGA